jgi:hypothetical protein
MLNFLISPSGVTSRIGPGEGILSGPFTCSVSPFFPILQDSRAEMQDSKGIIPFIALVFTSENAVFPMGEYRTVPAGDWGGGCGLGCGGDFGLYTGLIFDPLISPSEVVFWIGPDERILSGSHTGSVSPDFPGLQDSRAKMQDSKGILSVFYCFSYVGEYGFSYGRV